MTCVENSVDKHYMIEMLDDDNKWISTGEGPSPFFAMESPQTFSLTVWLRYLNYLNAREVERNGNPEPRFRLVEWRVSREKVVITNV